jgi:hypothetical protein
MPARHFTQKQVGIMTWVVDIVKNRGSANLAGIVDYYITEPQQSLQDRGRNRDILDLGHGNVPGRLGYQAMVDFDLGIGERVANHVALHMVIGGDQQEAERNGQRDVQGYVYYLNHVQRDRQKHRTQHCRDVPNLYEKHCRPDREDHALNIIIVVVPSRNRRLWSRDSCFFRVIGGHTALITKAAVRVKGRSTVGTEHAFELPSQFRQSATSSSHDYTKERVP